MVYNKLIAEMTLGMETEGFYLLSDGHIKTAASGKSFLTGTLSDKSGSLDFKVWDYTGPVGAGDVGKVVKIRGEVTEFKGSLQLTVARIRTTTALDQYDVSTLVPTAPIDKNKALMEIRTIIESLPDADYRAVAGEMLKEHLNAFTTIPAAKSVHHSFLSGLLMHTLSMTKMAVYLSGLYEDVIDKSLLVTGTLLHDFAKEEEFTFSELGLVTEYSTKGQLLGHLVIGAQNVAKIAAELHVPEEKSLLLQHLILSHHGEPEYGAAVKPICAEAELLSYIDLIDSRMEIYRETFAEMEPGTFSGRVFSLDKKIYKHK